MRTSVAVKPSPHVFFLSGYISSLIFSPFYSLALFPLYSTPSLSFVPSPLSPLLFTFPPLSSLSLSSLFSSLSLSPLLLPFISLSSFLFLSLSLSLSLISLSLTSLTSLLLSLSLSLYLSLFSSPLLSLISSLPLSLYSLSLSTHHLSPLCFSFSLLPPFTPPLSSPIPPPLISTHPPPQLSPSALSFALSNHLSSLSLVHLLLSPSLSLSASTLSPPPSPLTSTLSGSSPLRLSPLPLLCWRIKNYRSLYLFFPSFCSLLRRASFLVPSPSSALISTSYYRTLSTTSLFLPSPFSYLLLPLLFSPPPFSSTPLLFSLSLLLSSTSSLLPLSLYCFLPSTIESSYLTHQHRASTAPESLISPLGFELPVSYQK
ncbi:hypothetical protein C7M84_000626 [Penaeus vannamei]|uniref:Uncharacterized protein n=1 Tax=Penaeus vannamei TaxID=6689 RepID=A0A423TVZ1_PENVA|nr:hypothetical protein C7M84_000626 [Penaeus vannamei]